MAGIGYLKCRSQSVLKHWIFQLLVPHYNRPWSHFINFVLNWPLVLTTVYATEVSIYAAGFSGVGYDTILAPGQIMALTMGILSLLSSLNLWLEHFYPAVWEKPKKVLERPVEPRPCVTGEQTVSQDSNQPSIRSYRLTSVRTL